MDADDPVEEDGKIWYIINSAWLASWLQYAHTNKNVSPNPGPCRNECLLTPADDSLSWIGKEDLVMGSKAKEGDYRRVSKETWEIYCDLYPNSGPAIYVEFYEVSTSIFIHALYNLIFHRTYSVKPQDYMIPPNGLLTNHRYQLLPLSKRKKR